MDNWQSRCTFVSGTLRQGTIGWRWGIIVQRQVAGRDEYVLGHSSGWRPFRVWAERCYERNWNRMSLQASADMAEEMYPPTVITEE